MTSGLLTELGKNMVFVLEFLGVVAGLFIIAYVVEKWERKETVLPKEYCLPGRLP